MGEEDSRLIATSQCKIAGGRKVSEGKLTQPQGPQSLWDLEHVSLGMQITKTLHLLISQ